MPIGLAAKGPSGRSPPCLGVSCLLYGSCSSHCLPCPLPPLPYRSVLISPGLHRINGGRRGSPDSLQKRARVRVRVRARVRVRVR
eukprot:15464062-Alexandrium_andersonii.AAC.1